MNRLFLFTIISMSIFALACPPAGERGSGGADGKGDILVGEYGSMTGGEATFGQSTHNGIMMALDEINAAGGVKGRRIKLFTEDDQSKQEEAANAVSKLISQNNVVSVLGEVASSNSLAAAPICQQNKVPMISPSSTNPEVTKKGDYIFRICFIDPYQGEALAYFVADDLKLKRAAILRDVKSDYSMGLAEFFERQFTKLGGQIVADQSYAKGDSDFKSQLTAIRAANPQVLFVPGYYTEIGQIARQARELGMKQPLVGGDGWESPKLLEIGGKALEGSFYSNHYHADDPAPAVRNFVQKYEQRYGAKPDSLAALGYDAMRILADSMTRATAIDGPSIRDAIAATKNFAGVTGNITIGPDRNPINKKLVVLEIKNGQLTLRGSVDPSKQGGAADPKAPGTAATTTAADTPPAGVTGGPATTTGGAPAPATGTSTTGTTGTGSTGPSGTTATR